MTGSDHYREAERLLIQVIDPDTGRVVTRPEATAYLAAAQVHATLALAAALTPATAQTTG